MKQNKGLKMDNFSLIVVVSGGASNEKLIEFKRYCENSDAVVGIIPSSESDEFYVKTLDEAARQVDAANKQIDELKASLAMMKQLAISIQTAQ